MANSVRKRPAGTPPPAPRCDVGGLRAFVAVARCGTVGRAARLLGRTQPSVSARLATLEQAWGTRLFRRRARGMELTPEGLRLLRLAEPVLRDLEAIDHAAGLPVAASGELRVGSGDALGRERLPRALAAVLRKRPDLEVHLREGPGPLLLDALRDGEIDLALVVASGDEESVEGIELAPCITSEVRLLVPARWSRRTAKTVPLRTLAHERLVTLQPGSGFRRMLESACAKAGVEFRPAVEVGNLSLVRRFVVAGLGVAPVPAVAFPARDSFRGVRVLPLSGLPQVVYRRAVRTGVPLPEPIDLLLRLMQKGDVYEKGVSGTA